MRSTLIVVMASKVKCVLQFYVANAVLIFLVPSMTVSPMSLTCSEYYFVYPFLEAVCFDSLVSIVVPLNASP